MSDDNNFPNRIDDVFSQIQSILLEAWKETGFGELKINSERVNNNKIKVILQGSTSYRYYISKDEVNGC